MSEETPRLSDFIASAVADYLSALGQPGMLTGFVFMGETIDGSTGGRDLRLTFPETQLDYQTLGFSEFANEWIRNDIRQGLDQCSECDQCDDE